MKNYRRPLLILLLCILVVGLTGCSNDTTVEGSNNTEKRIESISLSDFRNAEKIGSFTDEGIAIIKINGKYGYIDIHGNTVAMPQYDEAEDFSNGIAVVATEIDGTDVCGAINMQGELVLPFKYKGSLIWYPEEEVFTVAEKTYEEGGTWKLLDRNGNAISDFEWDSIAVSNNCAAVRKDGKWGIIDLAGNIIIQPKYEEMYLEDNGKQIWVKMNNGDICQIDKDESIIRDINSIINNTNKLAKSTNISVNLGFYNFPWIWGDKVLFEVYVYQKDYGINYIVAHTWAMFDSHSFTLPMLKEGYAVSNFSVAGDYAVLCLNPLTSKSGYTMYISDAVNANVTYYCVINKEGKTVISPMEDDIELSGENPGVFCCRHDKNYYLMSEYGTKLTKNYKGIWGPRKGYYLYQDFNGLRGYLNQDGSIAIPAQYKNARQFGAGYAPVCTEDGWHIINPLGEIVY